nr:ABC transporter permease [uncultured Holophaga sp.]
MSPVPFNRFRAIARKEFLHVLRDPRALAVSLALPLILLLIFGYALTLDVDRVPLVVWDQSGTVQSRELASRFEHSRYFSRVRSATGYLELERSLDTREAMMALVIPRDFGQRVGSGRKTAVQVLADGSDANSATLALGYAESIVTGYSREILTESVVRRLGREPVPALELRPRAWFNTEMESRRYIIPGLIAIIMMLIAALLTSLTVAREWESGTMEQLISTPVRPAELILGKLVPYFAIGLVDMILSVLAGRFLFQVPLVGSVGLLFGVAALYLAGSLALGALISSLAKSQLLASQVAFTVTFLPAFLLSGFMFDISNMPLPLRIVTHVVPARYFVSFLRALYLKGAGLAELWPEVLLLAVFCALMITLCIRSFRKRLA